MLTIIMMKVTSLDLFVLVQTNSLLGKISNNEIDKNFNRLYGFFMQTLMGKINNNNSEPFEGFNEVSELINEAVKGFPHYDYLF